MSYDPFSRGPFPVGVRTVNARDDRRSRLLPIEIWYPAADRHAGQDRAEGSRDRFDVLPGFSSAWQEAVREAEPRAGQFPLVAFSHGYGGHRRQSTFFCTHLASHGYVVAAVEHTGNTVVDVMQAVLAYQTGSPPTDPLAAAREFITLRPADVSFLLDQVLEAGLGEVDKMIDSGRIGMTGHSFGGWTTLTVTARDARVRAALPLAPAGGSVAFGKNPFRDTVDFNWNREVPTLFLVAERDTLLPLDGMHDLLQRTPAQSKGMVVLQDADHMHFCDQAEQTHEMFRLMPPPPEFAAIVASVPPFSELCPAAHGYDFVRGLGLAHMDAHLKGDESAADFLAGDLSAACAARGFGVDVCG